jgi:glutaredoxin-related protein
MTRPILPSEQIHPAVRDQVGRQHADIVAEVQAAMRAHPVVVVGMAGNPFPKKARRLLDAAGIAHHDLDYGGYLSQWRRRNALKMWTGWPTFPMVFVGGQLIGGANDLQRLLANGELARLLKQPVGAATAPR